LQIVVSASNREGQKILSLKGSLNIQTIFEFQKATREESAPKLILDFSGVPYVDSAGLGALVGAYVAAQRTQRKLAVAGTNTQVKALIDMTHVGTLIKSYATVFWDAHLPRFVRIENPLTKSWLCLCCSGGLFGVELGLDPREDRADDQNIQEN
jgi:anti-sigma B factor antagonist